MGGLVYLAIIVGTATWVGIDASKLGARRGVLGGGTLDMGVASWVVCCLIIWIVSFPCYLVARSKLVELKKMQAQFPNGDGRPHAYGAAQQFGYGANPQFAYGTPPQFSQPLYAPPQYSPDGRWWWNGQQWIAVHAEQPYVG